MSKRTSRQRNSQPRRTLAVLESGAHDFGDVARNTAHEADDNTNSDVEHPRTMIANMPEPPDNKNCQRLNFARWAILGSNQ
jgi:hypothetical protein